ncbi:MAG: universal stress protein [Halieaceae bacterium]|jgi:universal stress protein E|nr:universal stress protein [Halieaceae bacterium]
MAKILIVADRGDSCVATSRGLELAAKLGHSAEVVAFAYAPLDRVPGGESGRLDARQKILDARRDEAQARIDKFATEGQRVALKVVWMKDIHPWIIKRAQSVKLAAVVKTGHDSGGLTYTSTDWHLLRECPAPILITAEKKWHRTRPVLAALDLDTKNKSKQRLNEQILHAAGSLAEALGVELAIISAIEVPALLAELDLVDPATYAKEHRETLLPHLKALAEATGISEKAFVTKRGPVDKVITSQAAKVRAQIVVMGTVARQGLKAKLIGNTAESVLHHLKTDVLAIKPEA